MGWLWTFHGTNILSENTCFRLTKMLSPWSWSATVGGCRSTSLGSCDLDATFGGGWFWWWQVMLFWKKATLQGLVYAPSSTTLDVAEVLGVDLPLDGWAILECLSMKDVDTRAPDLRCSHIQWRHINILGNCHKILIHKKYRKTWINIGFSRRKHLYTIGSNSLRRNCGKNRRGQRRNHGLLPTRFGFGASRDRWSTTTKKRCMKEQGCPVVTLKSGSSRGEADMNGGQSRWTFTKGSWSSLEILCG